MQRKALIFTPLLHVLCKLIPHNTELDESSCFCSLCVVFPPLDFSGLAYVFFMLWKLPPEMAVVCWRQEETYGCCWYTFFLQQWTSINDEKEICRLGFETARWQWLQWPQKVLRESRSLPPQIKTVIPSPASNDFRKHNPPRTDCM